VSSNQQLIAAGSMPSTARGWRSSLTALIAEFLLLAIPLNIVYGFAMSGVYRLGAVAGLGFASLGAIVAIWSSAARTNSRRRGWEICRAALRSARC